uniref:Putative ovule protein n=1 Tax=Solanum chacoense TaxID=4108 RepID=A0A0V0GGI3_SOLCH
MKPNADGCKKRESQFLFGTLQYLVRTHAYTSSGTPLFHHAKHPCKLSQSHPIQCETSHRSC